MQLPNNVQHPCIRKPIELYFLDKGCYYKKRTLLVNTLNNMNFKNINIWDRNIKIISFDEFFKYLFGHWMKLLSFSFKWRHPYILFSYGSGMLLVTLMKLTFTSSRPSATPWITESEWIRPMPAIAPSYVLRREIPMVWGTTTDSLTP